MVAVLILRTCSAAEYQLQNILSIIYAYLWVPWRHIGRTPADAVVLLISMEKFSADTNINDEFEHIQVWATVNKLVINQDKTKEIVFRRPRPSYFHIPLVAGNIEQLDSVKFLGVMVQNNFKMDVHVKYVLSHGVLRGVRAETRLTTC